MKNNLSPEDCKKVEAFLAKIRPMIKTGDVRIEQTEKNILFDKKYNMRHAEKIKVIESLTAEDCTKIELNNNPRYPLVDVHFFLKDVHTMTYYGEPAQPCVYIKMYAQECSTYDEVVTISFHEEGMHDQ
jgi:hypothetical protein